VTYMAPKTRWKRAEGNRVIYYSVLQYVLNAIVRDVRHELTGANLIVINSTAA
jgi:hypothetical protein